VLLVGVEPYECRLDSDGNRAFLLTEKVVLLEMNVSGHTKKGQHYG
jgi:hypothetical protein